MDGADKPLGVVRRLRPGRKVGEFRERRPRLIALRLVQDGGDSNVAELPHVDHPYARTVADADNCAARPAAGITSFRSGIENREGGRRRSANATSRKARRLIGSWRLRDSRVASSDAYSCLLVEKGTAPTTHPRANAR